MNQLQELVLGRLGELDLSYRAAAAKTDGLISHGTLHYIAMGQHPRQISSRTVKGLALALDLSVSKVQEAVDASQAKPVTEFRLPKKADQLSPKQRKAVLSFISALLEKE